jgi:hypothetical protein
MAFKKGKSGNPNGRPKGHRNADAVILREFLRAVIEENRQSIQDDLRALEPFQRLTIVERLMQYVLPRMQSIDATTQTAISLDAEYKHLEELLKNSPSEAIEAISERIQRLHDTELNNNRYEQN